jgi:hypothetical protein
MLLFMNIDLDELAALRADFGGYLIGIDPAPQPGVRIVMARRLSSQVIRAATLGEMRQRLQTEFNRQDIRYV